MNKSVIQSTESLYFLVYNIDSNGSIQYPYSDILLTLSIEGDVGGGGKGGCGGGRVEGGSSLLLHTSVKTICVFLIISIM